MSSLISRSTPLANALCLLLASTALAQAGKADLSLTLSAIPDSVEAGQALTYSVCVANKGGNTANKLELNDTLPLNAQLLVAPSGCQVSQGEKNLLCKSKRLPAGSSRAWSFVVLPGSVSELLNAATVNSSQSDANPGDNSLSLSTPILPPGAAPASGMTFTSPAPDLDKLPLDFNVTISPKAKTRLYPLPANAARECQQNVSADDVQAVIAGQNRLAFDLFATSKDSTFSYAFSSVDSLQTLATIAAGASGNTLKAALQDSRSGLDEKRLHPAINALALDLAQRNRGVHLQQGLALWGQGSSALRKAGSYHFASAFLNTQVRNYGAALNEADFTSPESLTQSMTAINHWIAASSHSAITQLVYELPERTRLVTLGSTALNAAWQTPPSEPASEQRFENLDGTQVLMPMLKITGEFPYFEGDGFRALELPLAGGDLAVTLLQPDHGRFAEFQAGWSVERLQDILAAMQPKALSLDVPKFSIDLAVSLDRVMPALVENAAFIEGKAKFSRLNGQGSLFLGSNIHRGVVTLDEGGVKASSVTQIAHTANKNEPESVWDAGNDTSGSVGVGGISIGGGWICKLEPHWDPALAQARSFIFAIRDRSSGAVLFMGRLAQASGPTVPADWTTSNCPPIVVSSPD